MLLKLIVLLALLAPTWAYAETLYVRAEGGAYGTEDGTSYANAFDGFEDMVWGAAAGQIGPGDTLIVCGTFVTNALQAKNDGTAGNVITIDGDCSASGNLSRAVLDATTASLAATTTRMLTNRWEHYAGANINGYKYITFKNLKVIWPMGLTPGAPVQINATSSPGVTDRTVAINVILDNIEVTETGTPPASAMNICVNGRASKVRITNSTIYHCADDGIYWEGTDNEVDHNYIYDTDVQTGAASGDPIQFGGAVGIQNTRNWIHHNTVDGRGLHAKQAIIISGDSDLVLDNVVEYNSLYGGGATLNYNPSGGTIRYNYLYSTLGGQNTPSVAGVLNVENQIGTNLGNNNLNIYGNLVVGEAGIMAYGIIAVPPGLVTQTRINIVNNTVIGFTTTGIRVSGGVGVLTAEVRNNIVQTTSGTQAFSFGSGVTTIRKNNIWFGTGIKDQGGGAADNSTGDLNVNPLLINPSIAVGTFSCCGGVAQPGVITASPTRGDHKTKPTSPARRAGTPSGLCADVRGRVCYPDRPDIGAYQASSGDLAVSRTARTP